MKRLALRTRRSGAYLCATLVVGVSLAVAQSGSFELNTPYQCPAETTFKILSCAGPAPSAMCQVETLAPGRARYNGNSTRADISALMRLCHIQTPMEAQAAALGGGAGTDVNGFKLREQVQVNTTQGWKEALIVAMNGNDYRVLMPDGSEDLKRYPAEVHRIGPPTARDRALGIFNLHERVQILMDGKIEVGRITSIKNMDYEVQISENRYVWANGRVLLLAPEPSPGNASPQAGAPPRPGLTSCAGSIEGVYEPAEDAEGPHMEFRSGRVLMRTPDGHDQTLECWMDGGKLYLHRPGELGGLAMPIEVTGENTLKTPLGEVWRLGTAPRKPTEKLDEKPDEKPSEKLDEKTGAKSPVK